MIVDRALNVSDTVLHFFYNLLAYAGLVIAYRYVLVDRARSPNPLVGRRDALEPHVG